MGCDSVLDVDGEVHGKPADVGEALARWRRLRGRDAVCGRGTASSTPPRGAEVSAASATTVRFGEPSDDELAAYLATAEPLQVAGAFTIDGIAAPFIDGIDGDPVP